MHVNAKNLKEKKKYLVYSRCEIHNHYFGHKIQNEFIHLLATKIKKNIIEKVRETKYFLIILRCVMC